MSLGDIKGTWELFTSYIDEEGTLVEKGNVTRYYFDDLTIKHNSKIYNYKLIEEEKEKTFLLIENKEPIEVCAITPFYMFWKEEPVFCTWIRIR